MINSYKVDLPFRKKFVISHTSRLHSESVFTKIELEDGTFGWGEALPREYVTGETQDSVIKAIEKIYAPTIKKWDAKDYNELCKSIKALKIGKKSNCALCAVELALIDSFGKHFKKSASQVTGGTKRDQVVYSGAVSAEENKMQIFKMRLFGIKSAKVKVGTGDDIKRINTVRKLMGKKTEIHVDANCAWNVDEAIRHIEILKKMGVRSCEQPVKTLKEMNQVAKSVDIPLIADESLCNMEDATKLDRRVIFNIRISKCGGLIKSKEIYDYAKKKGIKCMLGCQVGESGILSAAGRHFACSHPDLIYVEGSYNRFLLKDDITKEDLTFRRDGIGKDIKGYGLGVETDENKLKRYVL